MHRHFMHEAGRQYRVIWIEDCEDDFRYFSAELKKQGFPIETLRVESPRQFKDALEIGDWDAIISDYFLPGFGPLQALEILEKSDIDLPFIVLSGVIQVDTAVRLMRCGVHDYVSKEDTSRLAPAIEREIRDAAVRQNRRDMVEQLEEKNSRLEETLQQLREAQESMARQQHLSVVGEMAFGIAHDFNNVLMKIGGIHDRIEKDLGKGVSIDKHEDNLMLLKTSAMDGRQIVNRLAKFYRENGKGEEENVDLNRLIETTLEVAQIRWREREAGAEVNVEVEFGDIPPVRANAADLREAVTNIVFNSSDAMPDGGILRVRTGMLGGMVFAEIADDGIGMSEDTLKRCREPFFSTKGKFGTGLGLGLSESILTRYGGRLEVFSELEVGTLVTLKLKPSKKEQLELPEGKKAVAASGEEEVKTILSQAPVRILVAEDEPIVSLIIEEYLSDAGHQVTLAESGGQALDLFESGKFDLVITDRSMPGLSGDELAVSIKQRSPETPVFLMTGYGDLMIARNQTPQGVDRVLSKPLDRTELNQIVAEGLPR